MFRWSSDFPWAYLIHKESGRILAELYTDSRGHTSYKGEKYINLGSAMKAAEIDALELADDV